MKYKIIYGKTHFVATYKIGKENAAYWARLYRNYGYIVTVYEYGPCGIKEVEI